MNYDEHNSRRHTAPYSYIYTHNGQYIYYMGVSHSADPKNPMYDIIRAFWQDFLSHTEKDKAIAFIEGGDWPMSESEEQAILKGGDSQFTKYIATRDGVETISPEPPEDEKFRYFLQHFTKDEIVYYEFARMAHQWNKLLEKPDFDEYTEGVFHSIKRSTQWTDFDFSVTHMVEIEKQLFGREFDKNDRGFYNHIINPTIPANSRINELSRFEDSGYRDRYILSQIEKYWHEGKNMFIVYGYTHAIMQEPAIRNLN